MTMKMKQCYKLVVRVTIEAQTPLRIGSGRKTILTDSPVMLDVNGLPYIPGTTLAGVLRKELPEDAAERYFGTQRKGSGHGAEIVITEGKLVGSDGRAVDGLQQPDWADAYYRHYRTLPIRQHVRISHRGVAERAGKFDEEVVMKGTRFVFELEQTSDDGDLGIVRTLMHRMAGKNFRIGGGACRGFGSIKVVGCRWRSFCLANESELAMYLERTSCLSAPFEGEPFELQPVAASEGLSVYGLLLRADDFFLFGSGTGDADADAVPAAESIVVWNDLGKPVVKTMQTLIPATSVKGAILHRMLYHYNRTKCLFADGRSESEMEELSARAKSDITAFGQSSDTDSSQQPRKGCIVFNDIITETAATKIFNHVKIDRITGGTVDGALFTETASYGGGQTVSTEIIVTRQMPADVREAFEQALRDLCSGALPLGGATTRGYGMFRGTLTCNGTTIYSPN